MTPIPIVALDVSNDRQALSIVDDLGETCRFYKIGGELFTACGPSIVREVLARGAEVFLDLKYHDIQNTVAGAVRSAAALGARLVTVHASGGLAMLRSAVAAAGDPARCAVFAVTVLTSLESPEVAAAWGREPSLCIPDEVMRLSELADAARAAGVVCGGREAKVVKQKYGRSLSVLIPGIRFAGGQAHDQSRVTTPAEAAAAGADYVVVGRAVTGAADLRAAMRAIIDQLA